MYPSMTLKQYAKFNFLRLVAAYLEAKKHIGTPEGNAAFIALSLQVHAAKGNVPKRMWPMVNKP
jgi:hypothetical protein